MVYPGKEKTEVLDRAEGTRYVGIVAGYVSLQKERAVRIQDVPVSFFNNPKVLPINLYFGSQEIQKNRGK